MTRFFYTDPLASAWMANHFGMRFLLEGEEFEEWGAEIHDLWPDFGEDTAIKYHINPDSLHLLELQGGDAVEFDRWYWERNRHKDIKDAPYTPHYGRVIQHSDYIEISSAGHGWDNTLGGGKIALPHKIIQRNGIPFHWPEKEAEHVPDPR